MRPANQPESGSTIAFETRYDVSTQVDSSAPAERFPEICGSATLAIDVSSTSMNVASVTVTAITHGLIVPSGLRNLANQFFMTLSLPFAASASLRLTPPGPRLSSRRLPAPSRLPSRPHSFPDEEPLCPRESGPARASPECAAQP